MAVLPAFCVIFLVLNSIAGYTLIGNYDDHELVWPSSYHMTGEEINLMTQLRKPFEMWYSSSLNRSRCDYYGGTEKEYYYGDMDLVLKVHPITMRDLETVIACIGKQSKNPNPNFLPNESHLVYQGTESLDDYDVEVWKYEINDFDKRFEITMYVYGNDNYEDIPVRKVIKKYNLLNGALTDHTITEFYTFNDTFFDNELDYEDYYDCDILSDDSNFKFLDGAVGPDAGVQLGVAFDSYIKHHKKEYNENEHHIRKTIFEKNLRKVQEVNSQNLGFKLALNQFSDRTHEELSYLAGTIPINHLSLDALPFPHTLEEIDELAKELPESFDLRMEGVISPVKNQGNCGSCWSFTTTATVEAAIARKNGGKLVDLSEQSLIDCAWGFSTLGCLGGTLDGALKYVSKYGIPTEAEYGDYKEQDGTCNVLDMSSTYKIHGFAMVTPRHPNALKLALNKYGPVAVSIHASDVMIHYSSGVFYDFTCEKEAANHGVTVVGYGVRDGDEYWIVKNSWGESWGEDGYILMAFKNNNCLVLDSPYYPIV